MFSLLILPGDGIGPEVMTEVRRVISWFQDKRDLKIDIEEGLVGGANFGCGSSREHAPWALKDFGIKCIISISFADIFFNNCFKNGILPIIVSEEIHQNLMKDAEVERTSYMKIDLENQKIIRNNEDQVDFEVDEFKKYCLLNGLDDIGLTLQKSDKIRGFEKEYSDKFSWS